jgi:hypothetical protein
MRRYTFYTNGLGDDRERKIADLQKQQLDLQKQVVTEEVPFQFSKVWLSVLVIGVVAMVALKK